MVFYVLGVVEIKMPAKPNDWIFHSIFHLARYRVEDRVVWPRCRTGPVMACTCHFELLSFGSGAVYH